MIVYHSVFYYTMLYYSVLYHIMLYHGIHCCIITGDRELPGFGRGVHVRASDVVVSLRIVRRYYYYYCCYYCYHCCYHCYHIIILLLVVHYYQ